MNWEVQTMPSKTSFCNGTEFRKCLSRWWPLWVIYSVILFILLPGVLLNARTVCVDRADRLPLERHSLRDADAAAADGVLRGPARSRRHVRLSVHAARRGTGSVAADPTRVHVPHAPAGGPFDAAFGRGRDLRSRRAHRGWAYSRSRRSYSTASPCCAPCSPATWSCCRACTCS